jgi:AcrR family transcriptional regulator
MSGKVVAGKGRTQAQAGRKSPSAVNEPFAGEGYHHGDLREALIAATEDILAKEGAEFFTLRAVARRAGVSPAAPSHHFGNAAGLLVAVGLRGYAELTRMLKEAGEGAGTPIERLHAQGTAYVRFALRYPGRFELMFSNKRRLIGDDRLKGAGKAAYEEMERTLGEVVPAKDARVAAIAAWSTIHGFAKLAIEGKFDAAGKSSEKVIKGVLEPMLEYFWRGRAL